MAAQHGASSSFPSSIDYEVFLSFSVADTGENFTRFLYGAMKREGINMYTEISPDCLQRQSILNKVTTIGSKRPLQDSGWVTPMHVGFVKAVEFMTAESREWTGILPEIPSPLQRFKISIPVFSKGYADSRCCLDELVEIVRCHKNNGQIVLPIFLDVRPQHILHQIGSLAEQFHKHGEIFDAKNIEKWKEALTVIEEITGYDLNEVNGDQGALVESVVGRVLGVLGELRLSIGSLTAQDWAFSSPSFTYDVFISFRVRDTGNNFTSFLHRALKREGIVVYTDREDMRAGELHKAHIMAIQQSRILIPILSKGYANSRFCLDELVEIIRSHRDKGQIDEGQMVLPIFLDVEPAWVRHQTGSFGESFQELEQSSEFDAQTIKMWKEALTVVGGILGQGSAAHPAHAAQSDIKEATSKNVPGLSTVQRIIVPKSSGAKSGGMSGFHPNHEHRDQSELVESVVDQVFRKLTNVPFRSFAAQDEASSYSYSSSTYDVYLNFKGEDTCNNFPSFLHRALEREGIVVFSDSELYREQKMGPLILKAIRRSKIYIVVFSEHYADSSWCLDELFEIARCHGSNGQTILPIFLDVSPSDVRYQTESFEKSFQKHNERFNAMTVTKWMAALTIVGEIPSYELLQAKG